MQINAIYYRVAGIYIHIPFCKTRCTYCNFHSSTDLSLIERYINNLCLEISIRKHYLASSPITTIYIGGGTPSLLSKDMLDRIFHTLSVTYNLNQLQECTIECNPDDITTEFLTSLKNFPINRISMGIQSLNDEELKHVCRRHSATQAIDAVKLCKDSGFQNISIDLIMGLPKQTITTYTNSLKQSIDLEVNHISSYILSYEENTPLWWQLKKCSVHSMSEDDILTEIDITHQLLQDAAFEQYEISNYARPGFRSLHNSNYWNHTPYIGLGSGAHSFNENKRQWNVANVEQYCECIEHNVISYEEEKLTHADIYNETIMLSLRTKEGIDLSQFTIEQRNHIISQTTQFITNGLLSHNDNHLILTPKGINIADYIIRELFI